MDEGLEAAAWGLLAGGAPWILRARLAPGMGLVCHNLLHDRSGFDGCECGPGGGSGYRRGREGRGCCSGLYIAPRPISALRVRVVLTLKRLPGRSMS